MNRRELSAGDGAADRRPLPSRIDAFQDHLPPPFDTIVESSDGGNPVVISGAVLVFRLAFHLREAHTMAQTVVITGGTGALGTAVVDRLLADGVRCHVTWKFEHELEHFARRDAVTLHEVDCGDEAGVAALYAGLGAIDASIHIVGGFAAAAVEATSRADFVGMFELNAVTAFLCCREAIAVMRRAGGGRIVNVAARPAVQPVGGMIAYTTAKAAVASLTQCLAAEVVDAGIHVNAILPSILDTAANRAAMPDADFDSWPKPAEVAKTIAFLAGPENRLTSGALVPVYGRA
jgi:NAD(P)-dependent dehydrogenase (short-subunit alcohol dehydrogenase family)